MASRLLLHELTREEVRAAAPNTLAVFPVGATEQHGPHLPTGTDTFSVEYIAREAAKRIAADVPLIVTPTMPFGSSHHHLPFSGTMSLGTEAYYRTIYELTESLIIDGFKRIFILNGHGGNNELVQLVARDLALKHPVSIAAASYWTTAWDALSAVHEQGRLPGHAGIFEASVMMALRPELIREPRPHRDDIGAFDVRSLIAPYRAEHHGSWQAMDGYTDSPDRATAQQGQRYLDAAVGAIAQAFKEFYAVTQL